MLKRFITAWRFVRSLRYSEKYDLIPWDAQDAEVLQRFMLSPTGVKFRSRLRNLAFSKALESVAVSEDPLYHAGTAYGVQVTNLYIENHLPEVEPEQETEHVPESLEEFLNG